SPAMANLERLDWLNGQFIRRLPADDLARRIAERMPGISVEQLVPLVPLVQERLRTLNEASEMLQFFFEEPAESAPRALVPKGRDVAQTVEALARVRAALQPLGDWTVEAVEPPLRSSADQIGWPARDLFMTLRVAITGRTVTPPLIESMVRLGKNTVLSRLQRAGAAVGGTGA
nr:glutamate--tRNA ligase [Candidatus Dormibacteraeota bacterium]